MANAPHHAPAQPIARSAFKPALLVLTAVSFGIAFIPFIGATVAAGISHVVDRVKNSWEAHDEMKLRANYYRNIVGARLGKDPAKVTVADFQLVAKSDPTFSKVVADVEKKEASANHESMMINAGVAAAGFVPIPGLGGIAHAVAEGSKVAKAGKFVLESSRTVAGGMAGSALASVFHQSTVSAQEVIERIHSCMLDAQDRGIDPRGAVTPQLVFLLRVAQDPAFAEQIKQDFGHGKDGFHQMNKVQQLQVMQAFPALANAAQSEAYAVSTGILPVQELAARAPNLNSKAAAYAIGVQNATFSAPKPFADRLGNRATAPIQSGYAASVDAQRAAAIQNTTTVTN